MATPIGHSLAGGIVFQQFRHKPYRWKLLFLTVFAANAADLDFLPGIVIGKPSLYHHGPSHSIFAALVFGFLIALIFRITIKENLLKLFIISAGAYATHLILDYFTIDTRLPYGMPLFWPFLNKYFYSPILIFLDVQRGGSLSTFVPEFLVKHNLLAIAREIAILLPINGLIWMVEKLRNKKPKENNE